MRKLRLKRESDLWPESWEKLMAEAGQELRSPKSLGSEFFLLHPKLVRLEPKSPFGLLSNLARFTSGSWILPYSVLTAVHPWREKRPDQNYFHGSLPPLTEPLALRENQSRNPKILVQILILLVTHCVTLGKLLHLSSTQTPNHGI